MPLSKQQKKSSIFWHARLQNKHMSYIIKAFLNTTVSRRNECVCLSLIFYSPSNYRASNANSRAATRILCQDLSSYRLSDVRYFSFCDKEEPRSAQCLKLRRLRSVWQQELRQRHVTHSFVMQLDAGRQCHIHAIQRVLKCVYCLLLHFKLKHFSNCIIFALVLVYLSNGELFHLRAAKFINSNSLSYTLIICLFLYTLIFHMLSIAS